MLQQAKSPVLDETGNSNSSTQVWWRGLHVNAKNIIESLNTNSVSTIFDKRRNKLLVYVTQ